MLITLLGAVPSKKNRWRHSARGVHVDKKTARELRDLEMIAAFERNRLEREGVVFPLEHPEMEFTFYVTSLRADRDNKLQTLLDVLTKVGILRDDNARRCNGRTTLHPAAVVAAAEERTEILLRISTAEDTEAAEEKQ